MFLNLRKTPIVIKADHSAAGDNPHEFSPMNVIRRVLERVPNSQYIQGDVNAPGAETQALQAERGVLAEMLQNAITQALDSREIIPGAPYKSPGEDVPAHFITDEDYKDFISELITSLVNSPQTPLKRYTDPSFDITDIPTEEDFVSAFDNYMDVIVPNAWKNYMEKTLKEGEGLISLDEEVQTEDGRMEPLVNRIEDPRALQELETQIQGEPLEQSALAPLLQQVKNSLTNNVQRELLDIWMYDTPDYPTASDELSSSKEEGPPTSLQKPLTEPRQMSSEVDVLEEKTIEVQKLWNERHPENPIENPQAIGTFIRTTIGDLVNSIRQSEGQQPYGEVPPGQEEIPVTPQEGDMEDTADKFAGRLDLRSRRKYRLSLRKCEYSLCPV